MSSVRAIRDALAAAAGLTGFLASYPPEGGEPAIFTRIPIPDDAAEPYVLIRGPLDIQGSGTFADPDSIRDEERDIELIALATGSVIELEAAAVAMRDALSNVLLDIPGFRRARCRVISGPRELPADTDSYGRLLTINVHMVT
jgi:hypothetical protein